ncbi:MAG: hypothetical protein KDB80_03455 [Planctomycetes bacterium]|nr:hypothetical protein [Planctomycetota bacterium]
MTENYDIRPYRPGDEVGILEGFNTVFRKVCGEGYVDRDMEFWRWQFERNPEGHRIMVGVTDDGVIAGHYGGVPCRVRSLLGDTTFVHIVDSFVLEEHRAGLKRPGLFVNIGEVWQQMCREHGDGTMYGYPVITAQRVGSRFLGYVPIRVVDYLVRDAAAGEASTSGDVEVERVVEIPFEVDALFDEFAADRGCLLTRDRKYLHWRFVDIPGDAYTFLAARRAGRLVGFAVLRPFHELIPNACTVVEWVVPAGDATAAAAIVAEVTAIAREHGRGRVMAVFPDNSHEHAALQRFGFSIEPSANVLERRLNHIVQDERFSTEFLREHWWYTLGDTDLA